MNIFEYAMKVEKDGEAYYRELAEKAEDDRIKEIFHMLAEAEVQHYQALLQLSNNQPIQATDNSTLSRIKNVFQQMHDDAGNENVNQDQIDAYKKARDVEKKSREFYLEKAEELTDPTQKELCLKIAAEEQKHYLIMDNIIEFISHPNTWLEDAEWRHVDEY